MRIDRFSKSRNVRFLNVLDLNDIVALCSQNTLYYQYCPPFVNRDLILEEMRTFPEKTSRDDKYYCGFFDNGELIAIIDLIDHYPTDKSVFIGFFMMDVKKQRHGTGTEIITELCEYLREEKYKYVQLAWVKGNPQAEHFWLKNKFQAIKETKSNTNDIVLLAQRNL